MKKYLIIMTCISAWNCAKMPMNDRTVLKRQVESPSQINHQAIYESLIVPAQSEVTDGPGPTISLTKKTGRLTCMLMRLPESFYKCTLGAQDGNDQEIYQNLDVESIAPDLIGSAASTKTVGGLECAVDYSASASGIFFCNLTGQQKDEEEIQKRTQVNLFNAEAVFNALDVEGVSEADNLHGLPSSSSRISKTAGRLTCTKLSVPETVYFCTLGERAGTDKEIFQALDVLATTSRLPGDASSHKTVGSLNCTANFSVIAEGLFYCQHILH